MANKKTISLEELYNYLKRFSLSDSLYAIGLINSALKLNNQEALSEDIPKPVLDWINHNFRNESSRLKLFITASRLARFLILSGTNDYKNERLNIGDRALDKAIELAFRLNEKEVEKDNNSINLTGAKMLARTSQLQFPLQIDVRDVIGRAQLLFIDMPNEIGLKYNLDEKMKEYFDIGVFEFIVSGFVLWIKSNGNLIHDLTVDVERLKNRVTKETLSKFVELSTGTPEQYRRMMRGESWKMMNKQLDMYGLDPFIAMPAIKIENSLLSNDSFVLPQPLYLLQRASWGIFYLLSDKEQEISNKESRNDFRRHFGELYRAYVGKCLSQIYTPSVFIDLDLDYTIKTKKPDFAIIEDDTCILFEVKTGLLKIKTRTLFQEEDILKEIENGNFKKSIAQLNAFEDLILNKKTSPPLFKSVKKVVKIIVGYEDIYAANVMIIPLLERHYGDTFKQFQIATISDIELLGDFVSDEYGICKLFFNKINCEDRFRNITDYLSEIYQRKPDKPYLLHSAYKTFFNRLM